MENNKFSYTYSANAKDEVEKIRKKYLPKEEDKLETLRQLDNSVTQKATVLSLILGIVGALILGTGMCCVLVWQDILFVPGIFIGILGIGVLSLAYPLYKRTVEKERERIKPEILRLSEELLNKK